MLATERGLISERERIEHEYRLSRSLSGTAARGELIEALRRMKGITIVRLDLENEGKRVTIELTGRYGDLISAAVGLPGRVAGLTIERLALSAGGDATPIARLEGNFS